LLRTSIIAFCAADRLVSPLGQVQPGFEEFTRALEGANIPLIWVTNRTRVQIDQPRRKLSHNHPFIAEGGCGVYLPDGYFHLRTDKITRLGRFQCLPVAEMQPASSDALQALSTDTSVPVVALRSLSPREFARNTGLPQKEAGLARHRDFDELFFFAGAGQGTIDQFLKEARDRKLQIREQGALWSLAVGANVRRCISELFRLYERSLRSRLTSFGIATPGDDYGELLGACHRGVLLRDSTSEDDARTVPSAAKITEVAAQTANAWEDVLTAMKVKA
jgi:predicted mannosyl-3-phosphoglycerate phosphatase (HAD superfamily)